MLLMRGRTLVYAVSAWGPLVVALWTLPCGCGGCGEDEGSAVDDAGVDAGAAEGGSGSEGGLDAGADSSRDGGAADAGALADTGAARDVGPAGWTPLPGLPGDCRIERAEHPETLFTPEWIPCGEGFPGCSKLAPVEHPRSVHPFAGFHDGERGYFVLIESTSEDAPRMQLMARTDGPCFAAWQDPPMTEGACIVGTPAFGPSAASFLVRFSTPDGMIREDRVYHGTYEEIGATTEPQAVLTQDDVGGGGGALQRVAASASWTAGEVQPAAWVALMEEGRIHHLDPLSGVPQRVHLVGGHAIWEDWGARVRLVHGSAEQATELYYEAAGGDVKGLATDGVSLAWSEGYDRSADGSYARAELWTAPYARDPADLVPRKVRDLEGVVRQARVGSGYYAFRGSGEWHQILVVRLSDGRLGRWTLPPEDSPRGIPLWVSADEVAFAIRGGSLMRVQLTSFDWSD